MANVRVLQAGAAKPGGVWPYTLCIVANPWIELGRATNPLIRDPIMNNEPAFDAAASYIVNCITGRLPGQAETMFGALSPGWRILTVFDTTLEAKKKNALVAHDNTQMVMPRQKAFPPFLKKFSPPGMGKLRADVAFAVTASATHKRCSAQPTFDDDGAPGQRFTVDGRQLVHRRKNKLPGAVAFHVTAASLVPLHEFSHAASSFTNGKITDLYQPADGLNKKRGRPIPGRFCVYNGQDFASAPDRGGGIAYELGLGLFPLRAGRSRFPRGHGQLFDGRRRAGIEMPPRHADPSIPARPHSIDHGPLRNSTWNRSSPRTGKRPSAPAGPRRSWRNMTG